MDVVGNLSLFAAAKKFANRSRIDKVIAVVKWLTFYRASYASAVLAVIVCLSVRPSVCLSQVWVVQRRLNLGSD